jgi:hypothetical protein
VTRRPRSRGIVARPSRPHRAGDTMDSAWALLAGTLPLPNCSPPDGVHTDTSWPRPARTRLSTSRCARRGGGASAEERAAVESTNAPRRRICVTPPRRSRALMLAALVVRAMPGRRIDDVMRLLPRCAARTEPIERGSQEILSARSSFLRAQLFRCRVERPARFALFEAEASQAAKHLLARGDGVS